MADAFTLLLAALLALAGGLALGLWIARTGGRARMEADAARLRELDERLRAAEGTRENLRAELSTAQQRVAQLDATLAHERETRARMETEFKALSADALARNNEEFLKLARENFAKLHERSAGELEKRQQAVEALVRPIRESLDKVDTKVAELEQKRAHAYGQLSEQLKALSLDQSRLQAEAGKLSTALRSTSYAGSWGELQLRRVVEMADMLPHVDFVEQETATTGAQRADMVVRMPGGQRIVVDAKAPVQSYREAAEATDETIRLLRLAEHAQKVRGHIDALGAKNYWEQFQPAPEFVILFLPGDHFLTAALQSDATLLERALARRVLLATPTTLIALLKAAAYGWRQEALSQNAEEISALGRQLHDRIATFAEHLDKVGRGLDTATKGFNQAVGSFESAVIPSARRFAELGAKGAKTLLLPGMSETTPREVTKRE